MTHDPLFPDDDAPVRRLTRSSSNKMLAGVAGGLAAALGGGPIVAAGAIVAGLTLLAAGLLGGPRWLILPVIVLVVPLAIVSAGNIDLRGGVGQRNYRVLDVAELQPQYRIGMGQLNLDL